MKLIGWILWVAMWGASGYFTVRTIQMRIENRRIVKQIQQIQALRDEADRALSRES